MPPKTTGIRISSNLTAKPNQKFELGTSTSRNPQYVNPVFNHFLQSRIKNGFLGSGYTIDNNGNLVDSNTGITWKTDGTMTNRKGQSGTWNTKTYSYSWNKPKPDLTKYKGYQILAKHQKTFGGEIQQFGNSIRLKNNNGLFYLDGVAYDSKGQKRRWDINGNGSFIEPSQPEKSAEVQNDGQNKPRVNNTAEGQRIMAWQKRLGIKADGWWGKNTAAAYSAWKAKQQSGQTQTAENPKPIQATPGYGIHVGDNGVTLSTPNGQTTDITNSHNVSALINNGNYKSPNSGTLPTNQLEQTALNLISPNQHQFNRRETKDFMIQQGLNPEDYSKSERRAFRHSISNDEGDWSKASRIMSDARLNNKLKLASGIDEYTQLEKPQVPSTLNNNLVSLKFKQGGQMYKYQQGGQAQQGIEQQAVALVQAAMQGDKQATQTIQQIMQAAQQGDQQATQVAQLLQAVMQKMKGSRKARLGAKLDYYRQSIGECPEGQELVYFKKGGEICRACQGKKMQNGGKSDPIKDFKKKQTVTKHQQGGEFKQAFDNAYGKQRYFTWNGKVYAAYKGKKENDKAFQGAVDNLQEQTNALKDYGAGQHLGWTPGANTTAIKHNSEGNMQGVLNDVVVTAKRVSPKQKANNQRKQYFDQWTAYVKKWHPNMLGRFKNTMQSMGYTYNWNTGTYDKNGKPVYRLNNGQLQTQNIYTGNWNNINNSDALPGMPANSLAIRMQK